MEQIATTIEQSKHLLELGLDPESADMYWMETHPKEYMLLVCNGKLDKRMLTENPEFYKMTPAWSLSKLSKLLLNCKQSHFNNRFFYEYYEDEYEYYPISSTLEHNNSIDAAYEMMCWMINHGHIKIRKS